MQTFAIFRRRPSASEPRWEKVAHRRAASRPAALRAFGIPTPMNRQHTVVVGNGENGTVAALDCVPTGLYMAHPANDVTFDYIDTAGRIVRPMADALDRLHAEPLHGDDLPEPDEYAGLVPMAGDRW